MIQVDILTIMMDLSFRKLLIKAGGKTGILTLLCISMMLLLIETWRQDVWSTYDIHLGLNTVAEVAAPTSNAPFVEETPAVEIETPTEAATPTEPEETAILTNATAVSDTTFAKASLLPALVAAAVKPGDVAWMKDLTDKYVPKPISLSRK